MPPKIRYTFFQVFLLFLATFQFHTTFAQKVLFEAHGRFENFSTMPAGDSVLFKYDKILFTGSATQSVWVGDSLKAPCYTPKNILAAINFSDEVYLYSLDGKKRSRELSAGVYNKTTKATMLLDSIINIGGNIIGSFIDGKSIVFVLLGDQGKTLSIFEINKMDIVSQNTYTLPTDAIANYVDKEHPVEFYTTQSEVNSFKGIGRVKFYKYDKYYITLDQRDIFTTWLIRIDPETKEVSHMTFNPQTDHDFSSFYLDGKLFQTSLDRKELDLTIWDVESKNILMRNELKIGQTVSPIYFRYGRKNIIHNKIKTENLLGSAAVSEAIIEVFKKDDQYIIQTGTYYNRNKGVFFVPINPAAILVSVAATIIYNSIQQAREKPGVSRYFYAGWDETKNILNEKDPAAETLKEKIDNYEIAQHKKRIDYSYKRYSPFKAGVLCTYYSSNTDTATLVYFE
jgi:hypothetical protein